MKKEEKLIEDKEQEKRNNDSENTFAIWFMIIGFLVLFFINGFKWS